MIKRSRQREAIRQCLTGRYDHPTAETVYMSIKRRISKYQSRNCLPESFSLSDLGEIQKITVSGGRTDLTETRHRITTFLAESVDV